MLRIVATKFSRVPQTIGLVWSERKRFANFAKIHGRIKAWEKTYERLSARLILFLGGIDVE